MKKQTYVSYLEDENNKMVDFERWNYKKVNTVIEKVKWLYNNYYPIYKHSLEKSKVLAIYESPDGINTSKNPVYKIPINELLS